MERITQNPKISVIVPVYNVEKYLGRCLDSILMQDFNDIEVVCIDDGSTDSSLEILRSYACKDSRIKVITQKNRGVSAARNAGLDSAKGEWIAFVDSDDEVMPNIWETLLTSAEDEDFICFCVEEVVLRNNESRIVQSGYFDVKFSGYRELRDEDLFKLSMIVCDKLYRRSRIEECALRFPEGVRFEDNVFVLNFAALYRKARFVPQKMYRYFRREGSFTSSINDCKAELAFDCIHILDSIYSFWTLHGLLPKMQPHFEHICFDRLREAIEICLPWERAGIAYTMAKSLHRWNVTPLRNELRALRDGDVTIYLSSFPRKDLTMLKPLRGLQKIFYIGNSQRKRVCRVFGIKLLSWNK